MELSGSHYIYDNVFSRDYGLIFANVNTDRQVILNGTTETVSMFNKKNKAKYFLDDEYVNSPLSFAAEIVTCDGHTLNVHEQRDISRWMFNKQGYGRLFIDPADDIDGESCGLVNGEEKKFYLNCRFINPSRIEGNGGVVGFRFTMECDSYMLWQEATVQTYNVNLQGEDHNTAIEINVDSDMNDYIYPRLKIQVGAIGGDIRIINNTDSSTRETAFKNISENVELRMNGDTNEIAPADNYSKFSGRNFLRLLPGGNSITVYGNIDTITFEWENRRYL